MNPINNITFITKTNHESLDSDQAQPASIQGNNTQEALTAETTRPILFSDTQTSSHTRTASQMDLSRVSNSPSFVHLQTVNSVAAPLMPDENFIKIKKTLDLNADANEFVKIITEIPSDDLGLGFPSIPHVNKKPHERQFLRPETLRFFHSLLCFTLEEALLFAQNEMNDLEKNRVCKFFIANHFFSEAVEVARTIKSSELLFPIIKELPIEEINQIKSFVNLFEIKTCSLQISKFEELKKEVAMNTQHEKELEKLNNRIQARYQVSKFENFDFEELVKKYIDRKIEKKLKEAESLILESKPSDREKLKTRIVALVKKEFECKFSNKDKIWEMLLKTYISDIEILKNKIFTAPQLEQLKAALQAQWQKVSTFDITTLYLDAIQYGYIQETEEILQFVIRNYEPDQLSKFREKIIPQIIRAGYFKAASDFIRSYASEKKSSNGHREEEWRSYITNLTTYSHLFILEGAVEEAQTLAEMYQKNGYAPTNATSLKILKECEATILQAFADYGHSIDHFFCDPQSIETSGEKPCENAIKETHEPKQVPKDEINKEFFILDKKIQTLITNNKMWTLNKRKIEERTFKTEGVAITIQRNKQPKASIPPKAEDFLYTVTYKAS